MSFNQGMPLHWFSTLGSNPLANQEVRQGIPATTSVDKPKIRSMSANRAQNVAQAGVIPMNINSDSLTQLNLDNARMWDCLCLIKTDPTVQCENAIRVIFSLDDAQFLATTLDTNGNVSSQSNDGKALDTEKQRLMIENSRLHAILWVLRDNPGLQIDGTVAAVFRMDDAQVQDKFGMGLSYSPGCLSLLMKMGSKWKSCTGRPSPKPTYSISQILRSNRSRSVSSREMRSHVRRLPDVKHLWSWKSRKFNSTANWKATVPDDREPPRKSMQQNTIWLMPDRIRNDLESTECVSPKRPAKSKVVDNSPTSGYSSPGETYRNTNMNELSLGRSHRYSCYSNNAQSFIEVKSLREFDKRISSQHLTDYYVQQREALQQSLRDFKDDYVSLIPMQQPNQEQEQNVGIEAVNDKPTISFSAAPANLQIHGKPYPLPKNPTPKYFTERHKARLRMTGWEHPFIADMNFSFTPNLLVPNLIPDTIIGHIDARNKIIQRCDRPKKESGKEGESRTLYPLNKRYPDGSVD